MIVSLRTRGAGPLLLALAFLTGCRHEAAEEVETEAKVPVVAEAVTRGDVRSVVATTGIVSAAPDASFTVTAPLPARVLEIAKAEGQSVRKGEVLVRFQVPSLDSDLAARGADRDKSRVRVGTARAALEREESLLTRGIAPRKDVDDARRELADAEAALAEADATHGAAALLAERATVHARFDGVVARRWHDPGDLVDAASTDPVLRVIDPDHLDVEASVPAARLGGIELGAGARVFGPGADEPETATVASRPGLVDPATGAGTVRLTFPARTRLVIGTTVRVEIDGEEHPNVITLPRTALVREGEQTSVFVLTADGHARRKDVELGLVGADLAEVRSGVAEGERVVVHGQGALPDGAAVTEEKAGAEEKAATEEKE